MPSAGESVRGERAGGRVLCVVHYPHFGGPHNKTIRLREALQRRGWETTIAIPNEPGTAAARLQAAGVDVELLPLGRLRASRDPRLAFRYVWQFRAGVRALAEAIERTGSSVVQIGGLANPHAAFAAKRCGAAVVWQVVDAHGPGFFRAAAMALVRRYADAVMFNGEALAEVHGGESLSMPTFVYYPPVDTERFAPSRERGLRLRAELGVPPEAPFMGTVCPITPPKALEIFLGAAGRIAAERPDARFAVVGAAPDSHAAYAAELRRQAEALSLSHPVIFAGDRSDVEDWYAAFDVALMTSRSEGTTTTLLEAQSCGAPVVATRVGAVAEVVEDEVAGLLVEPERPEPVAGAVLRLLGDAELRTRMGRAGRETAVARFGVETCADIHARAYAAALEHA